MRVKKEKRELSPTRWLVHVFLGLALAWFRIEPRKVKLADWLESISTFNHDSETLSRPQEGGMCSIHLP